MSTEPSFKSIIDDLARRLFEQKTLLLEGRYDALGAVAADRDHLVALLDRALLDQTNAAQVAIFRKQLAGVVKLAQENETLLRAAKLGVVSAQARIKEIINRQRTIGVYAETGDKPLIPNACVSRQKLA